MQHTKSMHQGASRSCAMERRTRHTAHHGVARRTQLLVTAAVKKSSDKNVVCSKTLVVVPESVDTVKALCKDITLYSKAKVADKANGMVSFECMQDSWDPNVFHFFENYDSNVSLGRHNTSAEYQAFMQKVQPFLERPVGMALYESKNGKLGAPALQGGPKGEGGLDDSSGASGAASASSMKQTSATIDLTKPEEADEDLASELKKMTGTFSDMLQNVFGGFRKK